MINAKDADAVSEPAVLMRYTIQMTVQMSFSTVKWQNMHRQSVTTVRISISHWYRISARTVTVTVRMMHRSFRISECSQALIRSHWIQLGEHLAQPGWHCHHDHFKDSNPNIEWNATLDQAEKIGLGTREYELKRIK